MTNNLLAHGRCISPIVILSIKYLLLANIKAVSLVFAKKLRKILTEAVASFLIRKTVCLVVYLLNVYNNGERSQLQRSVFEHEPYGQGE